MLPGNELCGSQKKLIAGPSEKMEKNIYPNLKISLNKLLLQLYPLNSQFNIIKVIWKVSNSPKFLKVKQRRQCQK